MKSVDLDHPIRELQWILLLFFTLQCRGGEIKTKIFSLARAAEEEDWAKEVEMVSAFFTFCMTTKVR